MLRSTGLPVRCSPHFWLGNYLTIRRQIKLVGDGEKITDVKATVTAEALTAGVLIKRGKKSFCKFVLK